MSAKILLTDMDETLLSSDKTISEENLKAIRSMIANGGIFCMASGRAITSVRGVAEKYDLLGKGCYISAYNGALIQECETGKVFGAEMFAPEHVAYIINEAKREGYFIQGYTYEDVLSETIDENSDFYDKGTSMVHKKVDDLIASLPDGSPKLIVIDVHDHERLVKFREEHMDWENEYAEAVYSCPQYLEYSKKGVNKGSSVKKLCDYLGVDISACVACGDQDNDLSMIKAAGIGVAVKNAIPEVLAVADYITENDNNHGAIAEVINRFF